MAGLNTPYATLSFAHLFQPRPRAEGGEAVFSCSLLFDPAAQKSPAYKALQDACITAAREKFGANVNIAKLRMPFRDAGEKADKYAGYNAGDTYINPWSKDKPGIVNAQRQDILLKEEVWAGQLVRANVTPFAYDTSGNKGVSFALNHVQIVRTDTARIDGRVAADKVFDDGEVDEYDGSSPF
jgi:hypothetical protein